MKPYGLSEEFLEEIQQKTSFVRTTVELESEQKRVLREVVDVFLREVGQERDTAAVGFMLGMLLQRSDEDTLAGFGLDRVAIRVVGSRFREFFIWRTDGVDWFGDEIEFGQIVGVGRGEFIRGWSKKMGDFRYTFRSMEIAERYRVRGGYPPFTKWDIHDLKQQIALMT